MSGPGNKMKQEMKEMDKERKKRSRLEEVIMIGLFLSLLLFLGSCSKFYCDGNYCVVRNGECLVNIHTGAGVCRPGTDPWVGEQL
jgi:hypothetical protein